MLPTEDDLEQRNFDFSDRFTSFRVGRDQVGRSLTGGREKPEFRTVVCPRISQDRTGQQAVTRRQQEDCLDLAARSKARPRLP